MGSDPGDGSPLPGSSIFQSTLPGWGVTRAGSRRRAASHEFQSPLPGWGATARLASLGLRVLDFNPRSPDGERPGIKKPPVRVVGISIHAPRMGSDSSTRSGHCSRTNFNPRSPDGERPQAMESCRQRNHFNPRSPDGERPKTVNPVNSANISIHAPRMGSDNQPTKFYWLAL